MKLIKIKAAGYQHTLVYHPDVKSSRAPVIAESFLNDSGEVEHILENGNTILKKKYDSVWNPKRGIVMPEGYKGTNPDKTKVV